MVTASAAGTAVWDVLLGSNSGDDAELLAEAAEVAGRYRVNEFGSIVPLGDPMQGLAAPRQRIGALPDRPGTVAWFLRRFLPTPQPGH